jgi:hypothetical protein
MLVGAVLAAIISAQATSQRSGLTEIGDRDAKAVAATSDFYFALNDMDAQVANILLVGDANDLGLTAAQAQTIFDERRVQADADLQRAAVAATDPAGSAAIRTVLDAFGTYQSMVMHALTLDALHPHPPGHSAPEALSAYRSATDLLQTTLLPAARTLSDRNATALERTYQHQHGSALLWRNVLIAAGAAAIAFLVALQMYLARRFRRRVNASVFAATLVCAGLIAGGAHVLSAQANHLRIAKQDAFDSILALDTARAVSYDANADESRYLLDPGRAAQYQQSFLAKSLELVDVPSATIATFDQRLAAAVDTYHVDAEDIDWRGYYGTEFRNITFPGERAAAENVLHLFQAYQIDDRHIRDLRDDGDLQGAIAFCTSYQPGQSNYVFDQYDRALATLIAINQTAFDTTITHSEHDLRGWTLIPWLALAGLVVLLAAGTWPRFAEYR